MIFESATLVAAGTPQSLAGATAPTGATITMGGITSAAGGATQRVGKLTLQADPSNTGTNIYIGGRKMVKGTRVNVGLVLAKTAAPVSIGDYFGGFAMDDVWFDGDTTGDKVLMVLG